MEPEAGVSGSDGAGGGGPSRWTVLGIGFAALVMLIGVTIVTVGNDTSSDGGEVVTRTEAALDKAGIADAKVQAGQNGTNTVSGVDADDSGRIPDVLAGVEGVDDIEVKAVTGESASNTPDSKPADDANAAASSTDEFLSTPKPPKSTPKVPLPDGVERMGVYQGGKLFLAGKVPSYADGNRRINAGKEILGEDNVFNLYQVDKSSSPSDDGVIIVAEPFVFPAESADLPESFFSLADLGVAIMSRFDQTQMTITGHTDSSGDAAANQKLSEERAEAFKTYLVDKGVDASRVTVVGKGSSDPAFPNDTAANRAKNRRIEVSLKGLLLGE